MQPLTLYVLTVAEQVLAGVFANVQSGRQAASRRQLAEEAAAIVSKAAPGLPRKQLDPVLRRVMGEVGLLARHHPDLEWRRSGVRVLPDVAFSRDRCPGDDAGQQRLDRLDRLHRLVSLRRTEIDLSAPLERAAAGSHGPRRPGDAG